jgi:hypothetical protein
MCLLNEQTGASKHVQILCTLLCKKTGSRHRAVTCSCLYFTRDGSCVVTDVDCEPLSSPPPQNNKARHESHTTAAHPQTLSVTAQHLFADCVADARLQTDGHARKFPFLRTCSQHIVGEKRGVKVCEELILEVRRDPGQVSSCLNRATSNALWTRCCKFLYENEPLAAV